MVVMRAPPKGRLSGPDVATGNLIQQGPISRLVPHELPETTRISSNLQERKNLFKGTGTPGSPLDRRNRTRRPSVGSGRSGARNDNTQMGADLLPGIRCRRNLRLYRHFGGFRRRRPLSPPHRFTASVSTSPPAGLQRRARKSMTCFTSISRVSIAPR